MRRHTRLMALALVFCFGSTVHATLTLTKRNNFNLSWYFQNTSTKFIGMRDLGYYRDYNYDGLPDYLFLLKDSRRVCEL